MVFLHILAHAPQVHSKLDIARLQCFIWRSEKWGLAIAKLTNDGTVMLNRMKSSDKNTHKYPGHRQDLKLLYARKEIKFVLKDYIMYPECKFGFTVPGLGKISQQKHF
jgi:hypothetical protein